MNILALEPYYGGSHKAFIDGLIKHSRHKWELLTLPPFKWKWRMRHAAISMAEEANQLTKNGQQFDLLFCTDMLNLAEFRGLADASIRALPSVIYFHENQLTYPVRYEKERDFHFPLTNFVSCLAADQIWFNSDFHKNEYFGALPKFLNRMPDFKPFDQIESLKEKAHIVYPGLETLEPFEIDKKDKKNDALHLLWVARWEHDKNPELFFKALEKLALENIPFKLSVIGESFEDVPEIFAKSKQSFSDQIIHWGYLPSREAYVIALQQADIIVSTADHEFYGIAVLEAIQNGAYPLLPNRLSYPELLQSMEGCDTSNHLYDGTAKGLADRLRTLLLDSRSNKFDIKSRIKRSGWTDQFCWENSIEEIDSRLERMTRES